MLKRKKKDGAAEQDDLSFGPKIECVIVFGLWDELIF